jgi:hypothetical protein
MVDVLKSSQPLRFLRDAVFGLTVFAGASVAVLGTCSASQIVNLTTAFDPLPLGQVMPLMTATHAKAVNIWANAAPMGADIILMALAFSTLFALNLAFLRHLRIAHVGRRQVAATPIEASLGDATTQSELQRPRPAE